MASGAFRANLFNRVNVATIAMPPLVSRRSDIPSLVLNLAAQAAAGYWRAMPDVPATGLAQMATRAWPGNVRELSNAADRFALGRTLRTQRPSPQAPPRPQAPPCPNRSPRMKNP